MKFYCPKCKKTFTRDMRLQMNKIFMTKRGYKTHCDLDNRVSYLKPVQNL